MTRPLLLDLFCGAGGAAMGYHRAGFDVVGVDIVPQPRFPFFFVQGDALQPPFDLNDFDAIHASPPCQDYSLAVRHLSNPVPRLIDPVFSLLEGCGKSWIIENVPGAPLPTQSTLLGEHGVVLCGTQFGLRLRRHRLFKSSFPIAGLYGGCNHEAPPMNIYNSISRRLMPGRFGDDLPPGRLWAREMGVAWMNSHEAGESIPPAYTEFIGRQLIEQL